MTDVYSVVREAIVNRLQITAVYGGHRREMCPHAIGTKGGKPQALFFQFGGSSSTGLPPGGEWRCIPISGLSDVASQSGRWHTGTSHTQTQTCIDAVDVEVAY